MQSARASAGAHVDAQLLVARLDAGHHHLWPAQVQHDMELAAPSLAVETDADLHQLRSADPQLGGGEGLRDAADAEHLAHRPGEPRLIDQLRPEDAIAPPHDVEPTAHR